MPRLTSVVVLTAASLPLVGLTALASPSTGAPAVVDAHGSARQVYATGLPGHSTATLVDGTGHVVRTKRVDALGGVLFRHVKPGTGYRVREASGTRSKPLTVHTTSPKPWDTSLYHQSIPSDGYGYLTTRDGTKLAIDVHPPTHPAGIGGLPEGFPVPPGPDYAPPYPTLIEYSGYGYANPNGPTNGIAAVANLMGFAVVDVNMRGTGCSGGAFDFFEPLQSIDGYDVVETIAHQSWVKGGKVGMMGISYGGISQLFTAKTQPPDLAAISPLSVIDATATTLYPGGDLNTGFAVAWAKERQQEAQAAGQGNKGTQPYAEQQIKDGDQTCKANQALHPQAASLMHKIRANAHYRPHVADPLDPITFVHKIKVPTFMACQFEDEQTGGHCPAMVRHFTGTKKKWFTFTNGAHIDSLDPETFNKWYDFLELYVAHQAPAVNQAVVRPSAPLVYQTALGTPQSDPITLPPDPVQEQPTYDLARAAFEKAPAVRVLFDNGGGQSPDGRQTPGDPYPEWEKSFSTLPVPGVRAHSFFLGAHGRLEAHHVRHRHVERYRSDPRAMPKTDYTGSTGTGGLWGNASQWKWHWVQHPAGTSVSYTSPKLRKGLTTVGAGAVRLWVRSSARDADLTATVTEIHGGHETFVQSGWLRGSERKLARGRHNIFKQRSSVLEPVVSMRLKDARPLPRHHFTKVVIPLYFQAHAYRAGTRIRVTISAPNGEQPIWAFDEARPRHSVATIHVLSTAKKRSRLVLPVVPGLRTSTPQPPCPGLRNEPCRKDG